MLVRIRKWGRVTGTVLLIAGTTVMAGCATHKDVTLVDDPDAKKESSIPWNRQEKWESGGQFGNITDRR